MWGWLSLRSPHTECPSARGDVTRWHRVGLGTAGLSEARLCSVLQGPEEHPVLLVRPESPINIRARWAGYHRPTWRAPGKLRCSFGGSLSVLHPSLECSPACFRKIRAFVKKKPCDLLEILSYLKFSTCSGI